MPASLKTVTWLFIFTGISPLIMVGIAVAVQGSVQVGLDLFNPICVLIGIGIFRLGNGWRIAGLAVLWINLIRYGLFTLVLSCSSNIMLLREPESETTLLALTQAALFFSSSP